ncbi:DNA-binding transcriptional MerR regulator [Neobacillus niacini]|uniref:DUF4355 domain-containing protein n=1 Tax=Neobacillus niacini TaxID=86668 RepID=UPI00278026C0|nr:DUF4355 domain-containing protein [Neobacillus niacini]MDQ1003972.1 DNA-binding transcriptional MerR regulator [Neobacillus niacini]
MNLEEIKKFLDENKENQDVLGVVKQYVPQQEFGIDDLQRLVNEKEDIRKWLDSEKDKHFSKGLETFKMKTMPSLIDQEIQKRNPSKTPEQLELEKIKAQLQQMENEKTRESLKNKALTIATEKKIPTQIIDFFIGQDEDSTVTNLKTFEDVMQTYVKTQVDERLQGSYTPPAGSGGGTTFTMEAIKNMSPEEINKNWDAIQKVLNQN